jgi:hypothetical protein
MAFSGFRGRSSVKTPASCPAHSMSIRFIAFAIFTILSGVKP